MSHYKTLSEEKYKPLADKKGKFDYLSWSLAWHKLKMSDEDAYCRHLPIVYFQDGTAMVAVRIVAHDTEQEMWLPVMNHKNAAVVNPDAFAINTAYMRALAKCIALFGIGLDIFHGEDLPEEQPYPDIEMLKAAVLKEPANCDFNSKYGAIYKRLKKEDQEKLTDWIFAQKSQTDLNALAEDVPV